MKIVKNKKMGINKRKESVAWLLFFLLFLGQTMVASELESIKKKEVVKTYPMNVDGKLVVDNKYGNIVVSHWDRKEVSVRVVIESKASSERRAQEGVDRVRIVFQEAKNYLSAVTSLEQTNWTDGGRGQQLTINYYVTVPSQLNMELSQKYGNINLPGKNGGRYRLVVKYGNINAGDFEDLLDVNAQYSNVLLGDVLNGRFSLGYCGKVHIGQADKLGIESKYSNEEIGKVVSLVLEKRYGNGAIEAVRSASIGAKYSNVKVGVVEKSINANEVAYGTLDIQNLEAKFSRVQVSARYGNLKIGLPAHASFDIQTNAMKYGDFDIQGFKVTRSTSGQESRAVEINGGKGGQIIFNGGNYSNLTIRAK